MLLYKYMGVTFLSCDHCNEPHHEDNVHEYIFFRESSVKEALRLSNKYNINDWIYLLYRFFDGLEVTYYDVCAKNQSIGSLTKLYNDNLKEIDEDDLIFEYKYYRVCKDDQEFRITKYETVKLEGMLDTLENIENKISKQKNNI
jgi:hypothetical protein